jgi:hypothetical protein
VERVTCLDGVRNRRGGTDDLFRRGDEGKNVPFENQTPNVQLTLEDKFHPRISHEGPDGE